MGKISDMVGKKFYKLYIHKRTDGNNYNVDVSCDCNPDKIYSTNGYGILNGKTKSCGCNSEINEMIGRKFHRLFIHDRSKNKSGYAIVSCDCNPDYKYETCVYAIRDGRTKSCGCLKSENTVIRNSEGAIHNLSGTKIYDIWKQMIYRCERSNCKDYKYYGGKGISVCEEWKDVTIFANWAYLNGYVENANLSIDRINSKKGYNPKNCEWIPFSDNISKRNRENRKIK